MCGNVPRAASGKDHRRGYRRPKSAARDATRWRAFCADHAALFAASGLPGLVADQEKFDYFLMHAYVPMPWEGAPSSTFDVDELDRAQRTALSALIRLYLESFGDPGADGLVAILTSDAS